MFTKKLVTTAVTGAFALSMAAAVPATAAPGNGKGKGNEKSAAKTTTQLQFTRSVKNKLKDDGIQVLALTPARKQNSLTFVLPAARGAGSDLVTHTGTLAFARADRSVEMSNIVYDLKAGTVSYTQADGTVVQDAFDLAKLKVTKKTVHANLVVAAGQAAVLNESLSSTLFTDGMFVAKTNTKFKKS